MISRRDREEDRKRDKWRDIEKRIDGRIDGEVGWRDRRRDIDGGRNTLKPTEVSNYIGDLLMKMC
jgi:hypothetical protein